MADIDMKKLGFKIQDPIDNEVEHVKHYYQDPDGSIHILNYVPAK